MRFFVCFHVKETSNSLKQVFLLGAKTLCFHIARVGDWQITSNSLALSVGDESLIQNILRQQVIHLQDSQE